MKTGIEVIAAVKVEPRTEPLKEEAERVKIGTIAKDKTLYELLK